MKIFKLYIFHHCCLPAFNYRTLYPLKGCFFYYKTVIESYKKGKY